MANKIIPYNRHLKKLARELRKNMTPSEELVWESIRKRSLGVEFHRQVPILNYIVDFYCHEIGLVLEIDGGIHDNNVLEDGERQGKMEKYGLHFLRFTNAEVLGDIDGVLGVIRDYIEENA
ncbi:MAG: endonuclease domain-containing protein [Aequorivita sp.]